MNPALLCDGRWVNAYRVELWSTLDPAPINYHDTQVLDVMGADGPPPSARRANAFRPPALTSTAPQRAPPGTFPWHCRARVGGFILRAPKPGMNRAPSRNPSALTAHPRSGHGYREAYLASLLEAEPTVAGLRVAPDRVSEHSLEQGDDGRSNLDSQVTQHTEDYQRLGYVLLPWAFVYFTKR